MLGAGITGMLKSPGFLASCMPKIGALGCGLPGGGVPGAGARRGAKTRGGINITQGMGKEPGSSRVTQSGVNTGRGRVTATGGRNVPRGFWSSFFLTRAGERSAFKLADSLTRTGRDIRRQALANKEGLMKYLTEPVRQNLSRIQPAGDWMTKGPMPPFSQPRLLIRPPNVPRLCIDLMGKRPP